jgi:tetratricopeptide (TPR) repeat protein
VARQLDNAAAAFREALRLDPAYANAHNNLGNVLLAQGKNDEAIQEFREVVRLQPDSEAAKNNLAAALQRISQRKPQ